jgi:hypothetical protein
LVVGSNGKKILGPRKIICWTNPTMTMSKCHSGNIVTHPLNATQFLLKSTEIKYFNDIFYKLQKKVSAFLLEFTNSTFRKGFNNYYFLSRNYSLDIMKAYTLELNWASVTDCRLIAKMHSKGQKINITCSVHINLKRPHLFCSNQI